MNKTGFGFLRFHQYGEEKKTVDFEEISRLTDLYLDLGGKYFDTAYTYLDGDSERAIGKCLAERHPRESFILADKLPGYLCKSEEDNERFFKDQLERCCVDYFDVYMIHWLDTAHYEIAKKCRQFEFLQKVKDSGKAKYTGFSYHGNAALLEEILTEHPEVDIVQLQINYLDWESEGIQSRKCYETCIKHGKKVVVMEPVKGGTLMNLPDAAAKLISESAPDQTPASLALRFVESLENVYICLSGMNEASQIKENMADFAPVSKQELKLLSSVSAIIRSSTLVPCTGCRYCVNYCPKKIKIPDLFKMLNEINRFPGDDWKIKPVYSKVTESSGKASDCISCRACARHCPQNIDIPSFVKIAAEKLE